MLALTVRQRKVLAIVLLMLMTGWAVRSWRLANPAVDDGPRTEEIDAEREL